jgi:hypothetical protein
MYRDLANRLRFLDKNSKARRPTRRAFACAGPGMQAAQKTKE